MRRTTDCARSDDARPRLMPSCSIASSIAMNSLSPAPRLIACATCGASPAYSSTAYGNESRWLTEPPAIQHQPASKGRGSHRSRFCTPPAGGGRQQAGDRRCRRRISDVCGWQERRIAQGVVDFTRVCTVDKNTVVGRLASISTKARRTRFALARYWVFRAPHIGIELEDAVRQRIRHVQVSADDPLLIDVELSDGSTIQLIQPPEPPTSGGIERAGVT